MDRIVEARIEIPMGSQNKYEIDHDNGKIVLDRVLYSAVYYPAEYGYIEGTIGDDGNPLDILVFTTYPTFPGCYIKARIIGGMDMIDTGEGDMKLLAVNIGDPRYDYVKSLDDLSPHYLKEIDNFFSTYKVLQNKETSVEGWLDIEQSIQVLDEAIEKHKKHKKKDD